MVRRGLCDLLSSEPDIEVVGVLSAIMAGASGYVLRQIRGTDFVDAVRRVAAGQSLLDPAVTQTVLDRVRQSEPRRNGPLGALSDQERRVLELIAEGIDDQPADRRAAVPGREDGEEVRVQPAGQLVPVCAAALVLGVAAPTSALPRSELATRAAQPATGSSPAVSSPPVPSRRSDVAGVPRVQPPPVGQPAAAATRVRELPGRRTATGRFFE